MNYSGNQIPSLDFQKMPTKKYITLENIVHRNTHDQLYKPPEYKNC